MDNTLYEAEAAILERLETRLKGPLSLADVTAEVDFSGVMVGNVRTPSIALIAAPALIKDADPGSIIIETRWTVVAVARSYNDSSANAARDVAGHIALEVVRNLIGWKTAAHFGPLQLRAIPTRRFIKNLVLVPLTFGASTSIDAIP